MPTAIPQQHTFEHRWNELHAILTQLENNEECSARISQLVGTYEAEAHARMYPDYCADLQAAINLLPRRWLVSNLTNGTIDTKFMQVKRFVRWHVQLAPEDFYVKDIGVIQTWPEAKHEKPARAMCMAAIKAHIFDLQPRAESVTPNA